MPSQPSPHDAVFRRVLGDPVNAASQLRAVLPTALTARLDLSAVAQVPGSFVDTGLRWRHSDLLFTVPLDGRDAFVYVLVEHQSSDDPLMPFRILRYVVRIWDQYLNEHPGASRLPAVVPLVVYHHRRPWASSTSLLDLIDVEPAVAEAAGEYLPQFRFLLDDLTRVDEDDLRTRPLTPPARVTLLLLKIASGNSRLAAELGPWLDDLRAVLHGTDGRDDFIALLTYIEKVGEAPVDELHDLFAQLGPDAEEAYVTTAEMLRTEGRTQGRVEILTQLLTLKFGPLPPAASAQLRSATTEQLEVWTTRILTADSLDDVLR